MTYGPGYTGWCSTHGGHNALACPACQASAEHVCPLAEVSEDEAVRVLVDVLRATSSASQVVNRLRLRGMVVARRK